MPFTIIQCDKCSEKWLSCRTWGLFKYLLPDGRISWIKRELSWCSHCKTMQPAEVVQSIEELTDALKEAKDILSSILNERAKKNLISRLCTLISIEWKEQIQSAKLAIQEAELILTWRNMRQSQPKCLTCGSTEIEYIDYSKEGQIPAFLHPGCGGYLTSSYSGDDHRISIAPREAVYDTEGNLLPNSTEA